MLQCRCDRLCWDVVQIVVCHSPEVTTDGRNIVGLGRVGHSVILIKTNALRRELIEGRLNGGHNQEEGTQEVIRWLLTVEFAVEKSVFSSQI